MSDFARTAQGELDGSGVELAFQYGETYLALSTNDQFALALAKTQSDILLTGDRKLSRAADATGLTLANCSGS